MDLTGIISISGMPGLFKIVAQIKNGVLVESLLDKKRLPAYATHKVSELENITIYTVEDNIALADVFQKIYDKEKGGEAIGAKSSNEELKEYLKSVLPEYDEEKVYTSDIKKMLNWYNILQNQGLLEAKKEDKKAKEKSKTKAAAGEKSAPKKTATKSAKTKSAPVKTASSKVKVAGVRKTGVA